MYVYFFFGSQVEYGARLAAVVALLWTFSSQSGFAKTYPTLLRVQIQRAAISCLSAETTGDAQVGHQSAIGAQTGSKYTISDLNMNVY